MTRSPAAMVLEGDRLLSHGERLIVALDGRDERQALEIAETLLPEVRRFKVGLGLHCAAGPRVIRGLQEMGACVFLDLKLHDLPQVVATAMEACVQPGVFMVDVHVAGGRRMLEAAIAAADRTARELEIPRPKVLGVTLLPHLHASDLIELGLGEPRSLPTFAEGETAWVSGHACQLARLCQEAGLDGVVAAPHELRAIREEVGPGFLIVTPGIRPAGSAPHDQARFATPTRAVRAGASYLVVGRPITEAADPLDAARRIVREMEDAFLIA